MLLRFWGAIYAVSTFGFIGAAGDLLLVRTVVAQIAQAAIDPTTRYNAAAYSISGIRMCAHFCSVGLLVSSKEIQVRNYTFRVDVGKELRVLEWYVASIRSMSDVTFIVESNVLIHMC